ncbi:MAG TPA: hypothetical protein VMW85_00775 [Methanomassiliicoccales archaeon]|nr:hypothetical protein [Methanomassiliicoccales archaeon]
MGVSIAICEVDSDSALCKVGKSTLLKVNLKDVAGFEDVAEFDLVVPISQAKLVMGDDWEAFLKRNRLDPEMETLYLDKIKQDADKQRLVAESQKLYTGWIPVDKVSPERMSALMERSGKDDRLTAWDMLSFDEMGAACAKCVLSWDEGRGCMGTFGPENSALPEIAKKNGCTIIASVPSSVGSKKLFSAEEAAKLLEEVKLLREKLPDEGKMMVRRYSGVLDRLEKMGNVCVTSRSRFYFL